MTTSPPHPLKMLPCCRHPCFIGKELKYRCLHSFIGRSRGLSHAHHGLSKRRAAINQSSLIVGNKFWLTNLASMIRNRSLQGAINSGFDSHEIYGVVPKAKSAPYKLRRVFRHINKAGRPGW